MYIYCLRSQGDRLRPSDVLDSPPVHGRLVLRPDVHSHHSNRAHYAECYDRDGKELLHQLVNARVVKINVGMHITGTEYRARGGPKSRVNRYPQSWICASTAEELQLLVQMIPTRQGAPGFDTEPDDYDCPPVEPL